MKYIIAILFPPLSVLMSGRFFGTVINIVLTCLFYFPGLIHAWIILTKDQNSVADAIKEASVAQMKAQEEKVKAETSIIKEQAKAESKHLRNLQPPNRRMPDVQVMLYTSR